MPCFGGLKEIWEENRSRVFVIQRVIQEASESDACVHQVRDFFLTISFVQPYCEVSSQSHNCIVFCFAFLITVLYPLVREDKVRRIAFGFGHFSSVCSLPVCFIFGKFVRHKWFRS